MKNTKFLTVLLVFAIAQILVSSFLNLTQYVVLSVLPSLVLCMPVSYKTLKAMLIAFILGVAVDFFTDGLLGMTSFALVPVAFSRRFVISLIFGAEVLSQRGGVSAKRYGISKFILAVLICTAVYFLFFIPLDSAGTRTFGFNLVRYILSVLTSTLLSILLIGGVTTD